MIKIYLEIKFHEDHQNKPKIEAIYGSIDLSRYQCICITKDIEFWGRIKLAPNQLMQETFRIIDSCAIVLIDLSEKGVGLGIEAGYAYSQGKPIITIAEQGSDISETLAGISDCCFIYNNYEELSTFLTEKLDRLYIGKIAKE